MAEKERAEANQPDPEPSEAEFEAELASQQRRKKLIGITVLLILGGLGVWIAMSLILRPASLCKAADAEVFLQDSRLPPSAIRHVCDFPQPTRGTLEQMEASPPEMRPLLLAKLVAESPELFDDYCDDFAGAVRKAAQSAPSQRNTVFLKHCDLTAAEFGSAEDFRDAAAHDIILAVAIHSSLKTTDPRLSRRLARRALTRR